jgi:hypothetical protein
MSSQAGLKALSVYTFFYFTLENPSSDVQNEIRKYHKVARKIIHEDTNNVQRRIFTTWIIRDTCSQDIYEQILIHMLSPSFVQE